MAGGEGEVAAGPGWGWAGLSPLRKSGFFFIVPVDLLDFVFC